MKVTDLKTDEGIYCSTKEEREAICNLMHEAGLRWTSGHPYVGEKAFHYAEFEVYYPANGSYGYLNYAKSMNYKIYPANLFIMKTKETLQIPEGMAFSHVDENGVIHLKPKEKKYPMSNVEALVGKTGYYFDSDCKINETEVIGEVGHSKLRDVVASKEMAEAFLAMMQLVTICDAWNEIDKFIPNWSDGTTKWCIIRKVNGEKGTRVDYYFNTSQLLALSSKERAEEFFEAFPELIKKAERLL